MNGGGSTAVVGERLQVGNEDCLIVVVLERDARAKRAGVVAEVKRSGRAIAGENDLTRSSR
jgi:hypothetical protein